MCCPTLSVIDSRLFAQGSIFAGTFQLAPQFQHLVAIVLRVQNVRRIVPCQPDCPIVPVSRDVLTRAKAVAQDGPAAGSLAVAGPGNR